MSDDIVAKLRLTANLITGSASTSAASIADPSHLREAADEIERLRAQVDELQAAYSFANIYTEAIVSEAADEIERLRAENEKLREQVNELRPWAERWATHTTYSLRPERASEAEDMRKRIWSGEFGEVQ